MYKGVGKGRVPSCLKSLIERGGCLSTAGFRFLLEIGYGVGLWPGGCHCITESASELGTSSAFFLPRSEKSQCCGNALMSARWTACAVLPSLPTLDICIEGGNGMIDIDH